MGHNQDAAVPRYSNRDEPLLQERVVRVVIRDRQRIESSYADLQLYTHGWAGEGKKMCEECLEKC
jgi:hypothetical protein